ncbi:PIG-L family deacetylase [Candidatus Pacearchaeota archaeon]|nr:PIG-L family deacetylase [Candidatus Pacearchaeota archaeon]
MKVLVIGAHPDDVELGMGGTIAKYMQKGHDVMITVVTIPYEKEVRLKECEKSASILGAKLSILDMDADDITFSRKLVGIIDNVIRKFSPDVVYTHWNHDSHQDHVAISNATFAATRKNNCSLYMYEQQVPGGVVPYGFTAQMFVDISECIDKKIESCLSHKSQLNENSTDYIEILKGRAKYRGFQCNTVYAEAFEVVRDVKEI